MAKKQSSKYRGVSFNNVSKRWFAACRNTDDKGHDPLGKRHYIYTKSEVQAARAYDQMAKRYHKGNAILNFPDEWED
jgi:hypothetical protein